jgi:pyrimidine-nucleoside phosphorylase
MRAIDIIIKKRKHQELTTDEINYFIAGFTNGDIPDYQVSAWAMAVLLNGMTHRETTDLTLAMVASGDTLDLSSAVDIVLDKHSTGGVGDKTTLVVLPMVSANGLPVGKMSGHGLGFSGGTLDKMESIPGFRTNLSTKEFLTQLKEIGLVLTGQTGDLAPADGKLYALRDVTGTVPSLPLIASSIMSKKIAAGAQRIVLDVKIGMGAFMQTAEEGEVLAKSMVEIAKLAGRQAVAVLSDMNQPLGYAVGNALEVKEAIETLQGAGPHDFREHCLNIAAHMLVLGDTYTSLEEARQKAEETLSSGSAWNQYRRLVQAQGGDISCVDNPEKLPVAPIIEDVLAKRDGYLHRIDAKIVGETAVELGAGRSKKSQPINHAVGIIVHHKVGDHVQEGEPLFTIHASTLDALSIARHELSEAYTWSNVKVKPQPLSYGVIK